MSNRHLVDELEASFQDCLGLLTNHEFFNASESEETKTSMDQTILKFLELSRELETFFLQRRFMLSLHKPELTIREDISDLKAELHRKETLLAKHQEHLQNWQLLLRGGGQQQTNQAQAHTPQQGQQGQQAQGHAGASPVPMQVMPPPPAQGNYPQGPLAYLEQTTSNIGLPERR